MTIEAEAAAAESDRGFMWDACVAAWERIGLEMQECAPPWTITYDDWLGFTATRCDVATRTETRIGPYSWDGMRAQLGLGSYPPSLRAGRAGWAPRF